MTAEGARSPQGKTKRTMAAARPPGKELPMSNQPIIALLYDFDKTLCTQDMQNYAFIPSLGLAPGDFWKIANDFGRGGRWPICIPCFRSRGREAFR